MSEDKELKSYEEYNENSIENTEIDADEDDIEDTEDTVNGSNDVNKFSTAYEKETMQEHHCLFCKKPIAHYHHVVPQSENGSNTIGNIVGLCTKHHDLVHKDTAWQKKLAKKKTGLNKKYGALSVLNQIIPALTKELGSLFPKHFFATNGKSTYDYRAAHGVRKDHWLDAYCIACSVLPNDVCDKNINITTKEIQPVM